MDLEPGDLKGGGAMDGERRPGLRVPGQHARRLVLALRMRTLLTLGALAIITTVAGRAFGLRSPLFMGSEVALLLCILGVYRYVLPLLDRQDRGASGEELVGGLLGGLPPEQWRVLHDVTFERGNVDHIAVGPPGVFALETKSHPGPIRVSRIHGSILRQANAQRRILERVVGSPVEPVIVFSRAWVDRPEARRKGVAVVPAAMVVQHLAGRQARLGSEEVEEAHNRILAAVTPEQRVGLRVPAGARSSFSGRAANHTGHRI